MRKKGKKTLKKAFEELYVETICMAKKNKEQNEQLEAIKQEKNVREGQLRSKEDELSQSKAKVEELQQELVTKENDINKMLRGFHKLTNMLLH